VKRQREESEESPARGKLLNNIFVITNACDSFDAAQKDYPDLALLSQAL
jgi:hypothetical protein